MPFNESFIQAWQSRYGSDAPSDQEALAPFLRHRCVRKYNDDPISDDLLKALVAAAQSAGTSSHLQLWSIISIEDPEKRKAIEEVSTYHHVATAPVFLVFLADTYRLANNTKGADALDYAEYYTMAVVDAALACERMVCAAESIGLGTCYIGAVRNDPARMAEILDLPEGTFALVGLCLGWPAESPDIKPRLAQEDVWFHDTYRRDVDVTEFDERMKAYYEARVENPATTWSMRSARRADEAHLTGRHVILDWLRSQGWLRR